MILPPIATVPRRELPLDRERRHSIVAPKDIGRMILMGNSVTPYHHHHHFHAPHRQRHCSCPLPQHSCPHKQIYSHTFPPSHPSTDSSPAIPNGVAAPIFPPSTTLHQQQQQQQHYRACRRSNIVRRGRRRHSPRGRGWSTFGRCSNGCRRRRRCAGRVRRRICRRARDDDGGRRCCCCCRPLLHPGLAPRPCCLVLVRLRRRERG